MTLRLQLVLFLFLCFSKVEFSWASESELDKDDLHAERAQDTVAIMESHGRAETKHIFQADFGYTFSDKRQRSLQYTPEANNIIELRDGQPLRLAWSSFLTPPDDQISNGQANDSNRNDAPMNIFRKRNRGSKHHKNGDINFVSKGKGYAKRSKGTKGLKGKGGDSADGWGFGFLDMIGENSQPGMNGMRPRPMRPKPRPTRRPVVDSLAPSDV
jgi:hypothetical protein